jgi:hypothetical protein
MAYEDDASLTARKRQILREDVVDLRAVLVMRFGGIPDDVEADLLALEDIERTNRLVLVAANAPDLDAFRAEIHSDIPAFRILSESFEQRPGSH